MFKFDLKHYQSEIEIRFQRKSTSIGTHKTFPLSLIIVQDIYFFEIVLKWCNAQLELFLHYFIYNDPKGPDHIQVNFIPRRY